MSRQKYGGVLSVWSMTNLTSVAQMFLMPLMGLTKGVEPILSFNYGAGRPDRMKQTVRYNLLGACTFDSVCGGGPWSRRTRLRACSRTTAH